MKRYSTLHPLVMSFFSPKIYRDIAYSWRGACILYLLILVALTQIPTALIFHRQTMEFVRKDAPPLVAQVPRMTFADGKLTMDENRPYQIKDPKSGELLAVIDTTGATKALSDTTAGVLFTATQLSVKRSKERIEIISYAKNYNFVVTRERIARVLQWIERYAAAVIYLCSVVFVLIYRMIQALIFSLAGLIFAKVMHIRLPYGAVYRLAAAALTPAIVLGTVCTTFTVAVPFPGFLFFVLTLGYLMFAVKACTGEAAS